MLEYEGDVEETFLQSFHISYQDVFGNVITEDLKPGGSTVMVNNDNRKVQTSLFSNNHLYLVILIYISEICVLKEVLASG